MNPQYVLNSSALTSCDRGSLEPDSHFQLSKALPIFAKKIRMRKFSTSLPLQRVRRRKNRGPGPKPRPFRGESKAFLTMTAEFVTFSKPAKSKTFRLFSSEKEIFFNLDFIEDEREQLRDNDVESTHSQIERTRGYLSRRLQSRFEMASDARESTSWPEIAN